MSDSITFDAIGPDGPAHGSDAEPPPPLPRAARSSLRTAGIASLVFVTSVATGGILPSMKGVTSEEGPPSALILRIAANIDGSRYPIPLHCGTCQKRL